MIIIILLVLLFGDSLANLFSRDQSGSGREAVSSENFNNGQLPSFASEEIVAQNLQIPWEIAFLPNGDLLVTERGGRLLVIGETTQTISEISGVSHIGEGGLLGLAIHPNFEANNYIYLYLTSEDSGQIQNRVERYVLENNTLSQREVILEGIIGSSIHDGGRLAFGPDNLLYITTGDAGQEDLSQDTNSLNGKILRLNEDGSIPEDNPFNNAVYAYGLRNSQGLAWDESGNLWATDHGRSGLQSGYDELNLIELGGNYGWPQIEGDEESEGMIKPVIHSGADDTWAPSGLAYYDGSLFFAGLRGEALYQATLNNEEVTELVEHFKRDYGRLRTAKLAPDNSLYIVTNNLDGRGTPQEGDDNIIKVALP